MTIKELKTAISKLPDDMDVFVHQENDEFVYSQCESAFVHPIKFKGTSIKKSEEPVINCLVISDLI